MRAGRRAAKQARRYKFYSLFALADSREQPKKHSVLFFFAIFINYSCRGYICAKTSFSRRKPAISRQRFVIWRGK